MLRSMTGFGSAAGKFGDVEYAVEIRSVNNRYFKAIMKLPEAWASAETEIEQLLRARLSRGTVSLTVRMKVPEEKSVYRVNTAALTAYLEQLKVVHVEANPMLRIDLSQLLELPGVCEPPPLEDLCASTHDGLMGLIRQAMEGLIQMRQKEGESLKADLLVHCEAIQRNLTVVKARAPVVVKDYHQRLTERVRELTNAGNIRIDEENLAREIAIFAERCDVAEEVARLTGHVEQFHSAIASPEPAGRKMDFIAQEMLREANTIGSKANDVEIARAVVDIKTGVDRIKEQVQNAE
jgi:uncharacterized protein (TIGR00255 family)